MNEFDSDMEALTLFCVANSELDELEDLLSEFNIFEAAGLAREEIRHSAFLSFLLDPKGQHGLGDYLVTRFLQDALAGSTSGVLSVLDVELMDLSDSVPMREHANIDILLTSESNKLAVIIENKIGSGEHSGQLFRYFDYVRNRYPTWRILSIFLSPEGVEPTHEEYLPVSYESVARILGNALATRRSSLSNDVFITLDHYIKLLRRHVVNDSKLTELCQKIISKHRKALELLFEQMEDTGLSSREAVLKALERQGWTLSGKRTWPKEWEKWMPIGLDEKPLVRFWVTKERSQVELIGEIWPGDQQQRQRIFEAARQNRGVFKVSSKSLSPKYCRIIRYVVASSQITDAPEIDGWQSEVDLALHRFRSDILPPIEALLQGALSSQPTSSESSA